MNDSIVVYRSQGERLLDEAWMSAIENNPEFFLRFFWVFLGLITGFVVFIMFKTARSYFANKKKPWHHRWQAGNQEYSLHTMNENIFYLEARYKIIDSECPSDYLEVFPEIDSGLILIKDLNQVIKVPPKMALVLVEALKRCVEDMIKNG